MVFYGQRAIKPVKIKTKKRKGIQIMKTTKLIAVLAAAALTGTAAFAGDLASTTVITAKGQPVVLYRASEPSVAVYAGGRGAGMPSGQQTGQQTGQLAPVTYSNNKGQAITLYWAE
jgi:hypothetical protein